MLAIVLAFAFIVPSAAYAKGVDLGVNVGSGVQATITIKVNQEGLRERALELVRYWREDALSDTRVVLPSDEGDLPVAEYLEREGITREEYLNPSWSETLERIAIQRAAEANLLFSHDRPNGERYWTATVDDTQSMGEILAGTGSIEASMNMWAAEKELYIADYFDMNAGHYGALISPSNTCYGFASVGAVCAGEITPHQVGSSTPTNLEGD